MDAQRDFSNFNQNLYSGIHLQNAGIAATQTSSPNKIQQETLNAQNIFAQMMQSGAGRELKTETDCGTLNISSNSRNGQLNDLININNNLNVQYLQNFYDSINKQIQLNLMVSLLEKERIRNLEFAQNINMSLNLARFPKDEVNGGASFENYLLSTQNMINSSSLVSNLLNGSINNNNYIQNQISNSLNFSNIINNKNFEDMLNVVKKLEPKNSFHENNKTLKFSDNISSPSLKKLETPNIPEVKKTSDPITYTNNLRSAKINVKTSRDPVANNGITKVKLSRNRLSKNITGCPHLDKKHYAKDMCTNCYHSHGRKKKAWKCKHGDKAHYALGMCQNCYQMKYSKNRKPIDEAEEIHNLEEEETNNVEENGILINFKGEASENN